MQFKETAMLTVGSALINNQAKCLNIDLMKFHITVVEKLSNLSKPGSPHAEPQLLTEKNTLPWGSRQASLVALKKNLSFIFTLQAVNKQKCPAVWLSSALA